MSDEAVPYCLHDLKGRPYYMALGRYEDLLRDTLFLQGWRGRLETLWLKVQRFYPRNVLKDRVSLQQWASLTQSVAATVTGALLWQTSWYKNTQFIGGITTDDRRFFVKAYKHADEAILARQQSDFVNHYFNHDFTVVPVMSVHDRLVIYPLLPHASKPVAENDVAKRLLALHTHHTHRFSRALKPALDYIHLNVPNLMQAAGHLAVWQRARAYLARCDMLPMVPVHGDATPWNLFYSEKLLPVLVDYERAGWHVPYYDCWHFFCQPRVLRRQKADLQAYIRSVQPTTQMSLRFLQQTALLYLLDQLAYDLQDQQDYKHQKNRLAQVITQKLNLLNEILAVLEQG